MSGKNSSLVRKIDRSAATRKKEPQQTTSNETYTVKSGDSLWKIATNHNMSVSQLKNLNKLSNDMIFVGQKLVVSEKKQSAPSQNQNKPSQNQVTKPSTYTVKSGDSVWKIAHECGMSMNELVSLNGIKNNLIFPGQVLKVKAGAKAENVSKFETSGSKNQNAASNGSSSTYTVKSGDSVWKISHEHGMSMDELKSLNGLKDNLIIPGQVLKIKELLQIPSKNQDKFKGNGRSGCDIRCQIRRQFMGSSQQARVDGCRIEANQRAVF